LLFSKIAIPEKNIHRIRGEQDPESEAEYYARLMKGALTMRQGWPCFDLVLLGMGEDGHTASIFPDQLGLLQSDHLCEVASHPVTLQKRVTLTGKVINNAKKIFFLCTGGNKAERLSEIWNKGEKGKLLPAAHIRPVGGELYWYTDESAARLII
jgi:6-phosphogluconolactonase